jgi:DNA-binding transcriptional MocR family regulator
VLAVDGGWTVSLALRERGSPVPPRGRLSSRRALADEVSELIVRELILNDAIAPGELLPREKDLSERYGVSRVTVRACMRAQGGRPDQRAPGDRAVARMVRSVSRPAQAAALCGAPAGA